MQKTGLGSRVTPDELQTCRKQVSSEHRLMAVIMVKLAKNSVQQKACSRNSSSESSNNCILAGKGLTRLAVPGVIQPHA